MSKRRMAAWLGLAGAGLLLPATVWAYHELNVTGRVTTPANTGCISLVSSLHHSGPNDPVTMTAVAATQGLNGEKNTASPNGISCTPLTSSSVVKSIRGHLSMSLIKRITKGVKGRKDTYQYCRIEFPAGTTAWSNALDVSVTYPKAPCGAGLYAEIACIESADSLIAVLPFFATSGNFTTQDVRRDCNISPSWHPIDGSNNALEPVNI